MSDLQQAVSNVLDFTQSMSGDAETCCSILATALAVESAQGGVSIDSVLDRVRADHATMASLVADVAR